MGISTNELEGKSFIVKDYAVLTLMILRELSSI